MSDPTTGNDTLPRWQSFGFGALGGFIPVLLSIIAIDVNAIINLYDQLNIGHYVGHGIKIGAMLFLGGLFALLNSSVKQPLTLVQLGVAAPAIFTTYINTTTPADPPKREAFFSVIGTAHAADGLTAPVIKSGFLKDVLSGATQRLDRAAMNTYAIKNNSNGVCTQSSSTGNRAQKLAQLRQTFPSPTFTVRSGKCR